MTRIETLVRNPKRTFATLAAVLTAVGVTIGSGAAFTAQTANPSNTFSSGTLSMSNSKDNTAILSASGMSPGNSTTGTVDIQNTGTVAGTFSLSRSALTNSDITNPMSDKINLVVKDCGDFSVDTPTCDGADPVKYTGTLGAMSSSVALGSYAASEKHRYEFTVTFDSSADNAYQGDNTSATFQWDATS